MPHISHRLWLMLCALFVLNIIALWTVYALQAQKLFRQDNLLQSFSTHITPPDAVAQTAPAANGQSASTFVATGVSDLGSVNVNAQVAANAAAIQQLNQRVAALENMIASLNTKSGKKTSTSSQFQVKESVVFLGSGSTLSRDWTDIPSATVNLNTDNYPRIKEVHFEAGLAIVGGEAHVRLVNKTTGGVFYDSELSNNTSPAVWSSSPPLYLPSGGAQYSVQMKSTSGETATLVGARLRILVQ